MSDETLRRPGPAHRAFAAGIAGLGALCLAYGGFAEQWQTVPHWFPWPHLLAYANGAVLLAASLGLVVGRAGSRSALALTVVQSLWVLVRAGDLVHNLASIGHWYALAEALAPAVGSFLLAQSLAKTTASRPTATARLVFGGCCVVFGIAHFAFADFTATMVPGWLPARVPLAYLTGAFHIAAGLAIASSVRGRLAATLEAVMLGSFVLLVHVPSLVVTPPPAWAPTAESQWTELLLAWVIAATAGLVASSLPGSVDRTKVSSV